MAQEFEWTTLPVVKVSNKDKEMASMILSSLSYNEEHKVTRGFLYYNIALGDFVLLAHYERFLKLLRSYIFQTWPSVSNWDEEIKDKSLEDLEWDVHLQAYYVLKTAEEEVEKIAQ